MNDDNSPRENANECKRGIKLVKKRISVRTIVESVMLSGDLTAGGGVDRMLEGAEGHRALQSVAEAGVRNEVSLSYKVAGETVELTVYGRIDRLHEPDLVEEIKTTYVTPNSAEEVCPQHLAQAKLYAFMLAQNEGFCATSVRMTYLDLRTGEIAQFDFFYTLDELKLFFFDAVNTILGRMELELARTNALGEESRAVGFPFDTYRAGQHELMAQAFTAMKAGVPILLEAPTGTGKTLAMLFPAIKALCSGVIDKAFFLSARTTGQNAALDAVRRLKLASLRTVVISARDKVCINEERLCASGECPRQQGYYDRLSDAFTYLFGKDTKLYTRDVIRAAANKFTLCPFELALDVSLSCDVIICDYNYCFDPRVRLQRYFQTGAVRKCALLVDEAHALVSRSRDMYSATLTFNDVRKLKSNVPKNKRKEPHYTALRKLQTAMSALFNDTKTDRAEKEPPTTLKEPLELIVALFEVIPDYIDAQSAKQFAFDAASFLFFLGRYGDEYVTLYEKGGIYGRITLFCANPSNKLAATYKSCKTALLFSATLSPYGFYRDLLGLNEKSPTFALSSPFPSENLLIMSAPLSTRYNARERTMSNVASFCAAFVSSVKAGNFMIFLPSYSYLTAFIDVFSPLLPEANIVAQERDMRDAARQEFLDAFCETPHGITVGLAICGGVFAESIDLAGDRLIGAAIVGVGLPQLSLERDTLRDTYEEGYSQGYRYAYMYPGISKVLQAAGRIIRGENDRGALLLIDDRYLTDEYLALLPYTWSISCVTQAEEVKNLTGRFFHGGI